MMKALFLNVKENKVEVVNTNGLKDYYNLIGCRLVDIVNRGIKGKRFEIITDDEATFKENPKISAIDDMGQPMLCGNLIIAGEVDAEGNLTDLTDTDIEYIKRNIQNMGTRKHPEGYLMLCQAEY